MYFIIDCSRSEEYFSECMPFFEGGRGLMNRDRDRAVVRVDIKNPFSEFVEFLNFRTGEFIKQKEIYLVEYHLEYGNEYIKGSMEFRSRNTYPTFSGPYPNFETFTLEFDIVASFDKKEKLDVYFMLSELAK